MAVNTENIVLRGACVFCDGVFLPKTVAISGGRIAQVADNIDAVEDCCVIDAEGMVIVPGLVDVHVHLREPGFSAKETIASATLAAARGGYTTVCAMPNLNPAPDSLENLKVETDLIASDAVINVLPYATITRGRKGAEPVDFEALKPLVAGFSDDGNGVQDEAVMFAAMQRAAKADAIVAVHCEVDSLLRGGCIHDGEYARAHNLKGICSQSEWQEVERDIRLAKQAGCRLHICHISTAESVELVRQAKACGAKVTCETAPHYLVLCDEDLRDEGRFKMNPPLRSLRDMDALRQGLADGTIDVIATDHAPHTAEEKSAGLQHSAMGVSGLETALPIIYTNMVGGGVISLARMIELMSVAPRRIFGIAGGLKEGSVADLTVIDLRKEYNIDSSTFLSKGRSTPFDGMRVIGEAALTIVGGKIVYRRDKHRI